MEADLQALITDFADFKKYVLEVFATSIETNQPNDLRDTNKDQIINLLRNDMKALQDQLNVYENLEIWKSVPGNL